VGKDEPAPPAPTALSYNGKPEQRHPQAPGMDLGLLDYGARFYDPSLGRWHAPDPLAEEYLPTSPYAYVENSPVGYIDPNGQYKLPAGFEEEYPELFAYLNSHNVVYDALSNPELAMAFYEYSGEGLNIMELYKAVKPESGPEIFVSDQLGSAMGEYDPDGNIIKLNIDLVMLYEESEMENKEEALFALVGTLFHETVHYGDYLDRVQSRYEVGDAFGSAIFFPSGNKSYVSRLEPDDNPSTVTGVRIG